MNVTIRITALLDGLRRGGIAHSGTRDHLVSAFTAQQLLQMLDEPKLKVELVEEKEDGATFIHPWPADRGELEKVVETLVKAAGKAPAPKPAQSERQTESDSLLAEFRALAHQVERLAADNAELRRRVEALAKASASKPSGKAKDEPPK